jgi:hypothetical protein
MVVVEQSKAPTVLDSCSKGVVGSNSVRSVGACPCNDFFAFSRVWAEYERYFLKKRVECVKDMKFIIFNFFKGKV